MAEAPLRVGVVVSRFNASITQGLLDGALATLRSRGVESPTIVEVPGAFELPVVAAALIEAGHDCVVALGAVIEGETDHYRYIAGGVVDGLVRVATATGTPVGFGVLTVRSVEHAVERSRPGAANKGAEAAEAAVEAALIIRSLRAG